MPVAGSFIRVTGKESADLIMNSQHACEGDTDDTILPEDNVHEVPAEDTGAASSKLQSRARQLLRELSSYIYTTTDAGLLQDIINSVSALLTKCRAATASLANSRFNSRRRFAKMNINATLSP